MKGILKLCILFFLITFYSKSEGQIIENSIIFEYDGHDINTFIKSLQNERSSSITWELIGKNTNIYMLHSEDGKTLIDKIRQHKDVVSAQFDAYVEWRNTPNDPRLNQQYHHALINSFDAWDKTTGGKNSFGQDIVVAVVDEGFYIDHEDLKDNIYTNSDEIPDDKIDNDGNGFVDDLHGWNMATQKPTHYLRSHGTGVISMIGAKGNNATGIVGMNWNVKILPLTSNNTVGSVISCYDYILGERKSFNQSNGTKGANIVVTNYSGGLSHKFPADQPTWCSLYDKLGAEGILNVTATSNENEDVETVGDLPTLCTSPYLLTVSSTEKNDTRTKESGFGSVSVDVSAPGMQILLADVEINGLYSVESGTSFSTPIVAGAAGLIYSYNCPIFQELVSFNPSEAALVVKNSLINSVDLLPSLKNLTVSQGRININNALNYISGAYNNCGTLFITRVYSEQGLTKVFFISSSDIKADLYITDPTGRIIYSKPSIDLLTGEAEYQMEFAPQSAGIYYLTLIVGKEVQTYAFPVQK